MSVVPKRFAPLLCYSRAMPLQNEGASIVENAARVVVGKKMVMELMTVAILAGGHVLL
jgi:hypothetical protein